MTLRFKTRIALHYLIATGITVAIVFVIIFNIVRQTVYLSIDQDLTYEANVHLAELDPAQLVYTNNQEWQEREHAEAQVNPVFVEIIDSNGNMHDKSPNLNHAHLKFNPQRVDYSHFNTFLEHKIIRQVQVPVNYNGKVNGHILTAMSFESSQKVINQLRKVLLLSYPLILIGLFFISRFLAGRSIVPIKNITNTTRRINKNNLSERVQLPGHTDELHELSSSINDLLQRIEDTLKRERQFTSDASHELRTPLASLRGTLEVLIRKERSREEYQDKITHSLKEIDRMTETINQLLFLARFDYQENQQETKDLIPLIDESIDRQAKIIGLKSLQIHFKANASCNIPVPEYYTTLIIDNLLSNAVKYSFQTGNIWILLSCDQHSVTCTIKDEGIGINKEDLPQLFDPFFRSEALEHKEIAGTGLGLSIVKKAADAIQAKINVTTKKGKGSSFEVIFYI